MTDDLNPVAIALYVVAGFLLDCALTAGGIMAWRVWRRRLGRATPPPARA